MAVSQSICVEGPTGGCTLVAGSQVVMLGANDYLGLASHPQVVGAAKRALDRFRCGTAMSPPLCTTPIHEGLAEEITAFSGMQAATLFGSGAAANIAELTVLPGARGLIASDRLNHASIIDACRLAGASQRKTIVYSHSDAYDAERVVREALSLIKGDAYLPIRRYRRKRYGRPGCFCAGPRQSPACEHVALRYGRSKLERQAPDLMEIGR
jgi:7-keto-8-aminopelargonate synthetase-like enzyme